MLHYKQYREGREGVKWEQELPKNFPGKQDSMHWDWNSTENKGGIKI